MTTVVLFEQKMQGQCTQTNVSGWVSSLLLVALEMSPWRRQAGKGMQSIVWKEYKLPPLSLLLLLLIWFVGWIELVAPITIVVVRGSSSSTSSSSSVDQDNKRDYAYLYKSGAGRQAVYGHRTWTSQSIRIKYWPGAWSTASIEASHPFAIHI